MTNEEILNAKKRENPKDKLSRLNTEEELDHLIMYFMNEARQDERLAKLTRKNRLRRRVTKKITIYVR